MATHPTGTLTLVFTDLESSSELSQKHGAAFERARMAHFGVLREVCARFGGFEVETAGDALFVVFGNAADAVQFAARAQLAMAAHSWPAQLGELRVRIGLHTGEPFIGQDNGRPTFRGPATNKAARVQGAGHGGQSLVSNATRDAARLDLPEEISFLDCGLHRLKGVGEEHLWQIAANGLRRDFPPLNTLNPQRHNLPQSALPIVGREAEIESWRALLLDEKTRLLTLTGFGGLGKTRSALQLAELCASDFSEGVWWAELEETRSGEAMISHLVSVLHLQPQAHLPLQGQLETYLRERALLLVLDNTEQNPDAPAVLAQLLRATSQPKILVTTRRVLGLRAEIVREVPPLLPDDGARLFENFARAKSADFALDETNRADVFALCARLEGVPLAIELAASRICALAPREILRHLDQQFKVLQRRAPDLPLRQRALRGAIDWSFDLLGADDQSLLVQLAVFRRGFTLEDAAAVCENFDVFESVQELRDHSLLRSENGAPDEVTRFSMLESVREYAGEKLSSRADLAAIERRHAEYFLGFGEAQIAVLRSPHESRALRRFESHLDNVRGASEWARDHDNALAARLFLALGTFFQRRSLLNDAVCAIENGLECAQSLPAGETALRALLWRERAGLHLDKNEAAPALNCVEQSLHFTDVGDLAGRAHAHNLRALAAKKTRDFSGARPELARALELFRAAHDETGIAIAQTNRGALECDDPEGDRAQGADALDGALRWQRQSGDARGLAETLNNLGVLAHEDENWERAQTFYLEALEFERQLQNSVGAARVLINLSEIAENRAQNSSALRYALASAHLFERAGSPLQTYARAAIERLGARLSDENSSQDFLENLSFDEIIAWAQL